MIALLLGILLGIVQCFCGYRLFKYILAITGFLVGSSITGAALHGVLENTVVTYIAGFIGGIICAALVSTIYLFGVFVMGAFLGAVTSQVVFELFHKEPAVIAAVIAAIVFGLSALVYQKIMIIIATAFSGAWYVIIATAFILKLEDDKYLYPAVLIWLVLGTIGAAAQFKAYRKTL